MNALRCTRIDRRSNYDVAVSASDAWVWDRLNNKTMNDCSERLQTKTREKKSSEKLPRRTETNTKHGKGTESEMECKVNSEIIKTEANAKWKRKHHKFIFGVACYHRRRSRCRQCTLSASSRHRVSLLCLHCCSHSAFQLNVRLESRPFFGRLDGLFSKVCAIGMGHYFELQHQFETNSNAKCKIHLVASKMRKCAQLIHFSFESNFIGMHLLLFCAQNVNIYAQ